MHTCFCLYLICLCKCTCICTFKCIRALLNMYWPLSNMYWGNSGLELGVLDIRGRYNRGKDYVCARPTRRCQRPRNLGRMTCLALIAVLWCRPQLAAEAAYTPLRTYRVRSLAQLSANCPMARTELGPHMQFDWNPFVGQRVGEAGHPGPSLRLASTVVSQTE